VAAARHQDQAEPADVDGERLLGHEPVPEQRCRGRREQGDAARDDRRAGGQHGPQPVVLERDRAQQGDPDGLDRRSSGEGRAPLPQRGRPADVVVVGVRDHDRVEALEVHAEGLGVRDERRAAPPRRLRPTSNRMRVVVPPWTRSAGRTRPVSATSAVLAVSRSTTA
jgi:hypothetical protein